MRELRKEAAVIATGLRAGKWRLNRASFLHAAGQVKAWSGEEVTVDAEGEALAAALEWLAQIAGTEESKAGGVHVQMPAAILWMPVAGSTRAFVAGPHYIEAQWLAEIRKAAAPAHAYLAGWGAAPPEGLRKLPCAAAVAADLGDHESLENKKRQTRTGGQLPGTIASGATEDALPFGPAFQARLGCSRIKKLRRINDRM